MASVSLIVYSGDYDRAMASLTIANGALGEKAKVTIFFTFWGVSLLRVRNRPGKGLIQNAFKLLMPLGPDSLPLSRFNFLGLGPVLLRRLIRAQNGQTLRDLLDMALDRGVELIACEASLKLMGITRGELLPTERLRIGNVHDFLAAARDADLCLMI
ncbi:MAG: DsrE/DsrF/DrsH-like family protein [Bacteroidota bacterium]